MVQNNSKEMYKINGLYEPTCESIEGFVLFCLKSNILQDVCFTPSHNDLPHCGQSDFPTFQLMAVVHYHYAVLSKSYFSDKRNLESGLL